MSLIEVKMASASPLKEIDDKFCLCSICLDQLKEPKLLLCLHRFCKDCLNTLIQASNDTFRCPECREEIQIPPNGVNGFKTDFYMKNLVEYVQIQQSLQSDEIRECYGCSKQLRVTAYCFKCNDFMCKDCHNFHVKNNFLKDHQKHTLSLEDIETKNISIEKLASMRDAPRCHSHPEKISELYCETCNNLPICVACMFGEHKGHELHEVKALAKSKREILSQKLECLERLKKDNMLTTSGQAKGKLISNVTSEKQKLLKIYEDKAQKANAKIHDMEERKEQIKHEKQNTETQTFDSLQREMEKEIQEVKEKYEEMFKGKRIEISDAFQARESFVEKEIARLNKQLEHFDRDKKKLLESIEMELNKNLKDIDAMLEHFDNTNKRLINLQNLASTITASENDWTAVQLIPDINTAADNLIKDLKREYPELETLTDVTANYKQSSFGKLSISKISKEVEKIMTINSTCYYVNGVTRSGDGNIVISGGPYQGKEAFIIVIDVNGKEIKQTKVNVGRNKPWHVCDFLLQHKVATVHSPNTIGVYNVLDGSYIEKNIRDVVSSWPKDRGRRCVATDPVNNHILVGSESSREVYVFDTQLNYLHILTLPEKIKWPRDITVSDGHLLVCDESGRKSYVITMNELNIKVVGEFMKPELGENDWIPFSICTDKNGSVYMLGQCQRQYYLVQYNHDGSQVLTTRKMAYKAFTVAVVETFQGEKLVVATQHTKTVYVYGLLDED